MSENLTSTLYPEAWFDEDFTAIDAVVPAALTLSSGAQSGNSIALTYYVGALASGAQSSAVASFKTPQLVPLGTIAAQSVSTLKFAAIFTGLASAAQSISTVKVSVPILLPLSSVAAQSTSTIAVSVSVTTPGIYASELEWRYSGGVSNVTPATSLGGVISTTNGAVGNGWPVSSEKIGNVFPPVSTDQSYAGVDNYFCCYIRNNTDSGDTWAGVKLWVETAPVVGAISLAKDSAALGATAASTSADVHSAPTGGGAPYTFTSPTTKAGGIDLGDIPPGSYQAIWVKRSIPSHVSSGANEEVSIRTEGETAGVPDRAFVTSGVKYVEVRTNREPLGFYSGNLVYKEINEIGIWDVYYNGVSLTSPGTPQTVPVDSCSVRGSKVLGTKARDASGSSNPGVGVGHDLYYWDLSDNSEHRLTTGIPGVIWPRFKPTSDRIIWAQYRGGGDWTEIMGYWEVHVADIVAGALSGEYSFRAVDASEHFFETYGWFPDGDLMYDSCAGVVGGWPHPLSAQIWKRPDAPDPQTPVRVTPAFAGTDKYHEFGYIAPVGMFTDGPDPWLIVGIAYGGDSGGIDFWRQQLDGSMRTRLTYFNNIRYMNLGMACFDTGNVKIMHLGAQEFATNYISAYYKLTMP